MADSTLWWLLAGSAIALELFTGTFYLLMLAVGRGVLERERLERVGARACSSRGTLHRKPLSRAQTL